MLPVKSCFIWPSGFREDFYDSNIQNCLMADIFVNGLEQNEQSLQRICHRCCLLSFGSFDQAFSEENISRSNQPETRIANGGHIC